MLERFQLVSWWRTKIRHEGRRIQVIQLADRDLSDIPKLAITTSLKQLLGIAACERLDGHDVTHNTWRVIAQGKFALVCIGISTRPDCDRIVAAIATRYGMCNVRAGIAPDPAT